MKFYQVIFLPEAEEDLEDLGSATRKRCLAKIEWLASHPEVLGKKPLRHLPIALKGLNSYPVYREAHLALAQLFRETGRLTDAEAEYRKLLKIDSEDVQAHLSLGLLFEEQELYKQALKEYEEVLRLEPDNQEAQILIQAIQKSGKIKRKQSQQ